MTAVQVYGSPFMDGQIGKPTWIQSQNWEQLMAETRFWTLYDDSGKRIEWASLDREERKEMRLVEKGR